MNLTRVHDHLYQRETHAVRVDVLETPMLGAEGFLAGRALPQYTSTLHWHIIGGFNC